VDVFIAAAPPARTRRASSMAMPAVRLPTEESVRPPSLGTVPAAPKVPSLAGLEDELNGQSANAPLFGTPSPVRSTSSPPKSSVSIPPPAGAPSVRVPPPATARSVPPLSPLSVPTRPATASAPPVAKPTEATPVAKPAETPATETPVAKAPPAAAVESVRLFAEEPATTTPRAVTETPATPAPTTTRPSTPAAATAPAPTTTAPAPAASDETPAIFGSDSVVPPAPSNAERTTEPPPPPIAKKSVEAQTEPTPMPSQRPRSMPPPPSISVDPAVYEEASKRHATIARPESPAASWKINAALALSILSAVLGGAALARTFARREPATHTAPSVAASSDDRSMPSPSTRAQIDDRIEGLSAEISAFPTRALSKVRRARLLALRAEHQRGIAEDLEAIAATHTGEEAVLDRAEARLLRRQATQDAARASADVTSVRAEVPAAAARAEWTLSLAHAAIAADPTSREATDYLASARAAGAQVRWLEAVVARSRGESADSALEQARAEGDAPTLAALTLARAARSARHMDVARQHANAVLQSHADDEGARSVLRTLDVEGGASAAQPAQTADSNAAQEQPAQEQPAQEQPATSAPAEYLARVQAGRRALEIRMLPRARTEFRRALAIKSDGVEAQIGLAWVALRIGYYPVAAQSFRRLFSQGHNTPEVRAGLGLAHAKMREREPAVRYLRAYLGSNPQGPLAVEARQALAALGAG
jgi:hypothetical protein